MRETIKTYNRWMQLMHWMLALLIISMLIVGFTMESYPDNYKRFTYNLHKSFGLTIFFLVLLRWVIRLQSKIPPAPRAIPKSQQLAAKYAHYVLYTCMLLMPISGYLMSTGGGHPVAWFGIETQPLIEKNKAVYGIAQEAHFIIGLVFASFISLHLLGTIKHHLFDKIPILNRMTKS